MTNKTNLIIAASILALSAGSLTPVLAKDGARSERAGKFSARMISRYDTDGNGGVTLEEFLAVEDDRFSDADGDKDGFITALELENAKDGKAERRGGGMFSRLDTDKDGRVSRAEAEADAAARVEKRFSRLDKNQDGYIGKAEMSGSKDRAGKKRGDHRMERVDTDKDGRISSAEAEAARKARFARLDTDKDGTVTVAELSERMKKRRHGKRRHGGSN